MFTLTEAFKAEYSKFINEQDEREFERTFAALEESQKEVEQALDIVQGYFRALGSPLKEGINDGKGPGKSDSFSGSNRDNRRDDRDNRKNIGAQYSDKSEKESTKSFSNVINILGADPRSGLPEYDPIVGQARATPIGQMKFPENLLFFIDSLVKWIVNLVMKFISFITNAIRRFFGLSEGRETLTSDDLKLSLQKIEKIRSIATVLSQRDVDKFKMSPKVATVVQIDGARDFELVNSLREEFLFEYGNDEYRDEDKDDLGAPRPRYSNKPIYGVSIDISREMENLDQLLQHFLDMYDNGFGSNQEHLFGVDDLEILLKLFQSALKDMNKGTVSRYAVAGKLVQADYLAAGKLKDNLLRTKVNTDNLKQVFIETQKRIENTLTMITQKQLLASQQMGISFKFYSAATYAQMIKILEAIEPRIIDAAKMEREMEKVKKMFDKIVIELGKQRQALMGYGDVVYTTQAQRQTDELFNGARYLSQTVSLRLATLGLYLKQLRDTRVGVSTIVAVVSSSRSVFNPKLLSQ
jgi:hypothetical protein